MAKIRTTYFTVEGAGHFPTDMLRYDQAWPERTDDALALLGYTGPRPSIEFFHNRRQVRLVTHADITPDRWVSFGWLVTKHETRSF